MTIKNGFKSSIGWNLGKKIKSIHLLEPFISIPIMGTKIKKIKHKTNKIFEILIKSFSFNDEKKIIKKTPIPTYKKCLKKK